MLVHARDSITVQAFSKTKSNEDAAITVEPCLHIMVTNKTCTILGCQTRKKNALLEQEENTWWHKTGGDARRCILTLPPDWQERPV